MALIDYISVEGARKKDNDDHVTYDLPKIGSPTDPDTLLVKNVNDAFANLHQNDPSFNYEVLTSGQPGFKAQGRKQSVYNFIRDTLGFNVTTFYLSGHGETVYIAGKAQPPVAEWGACLFWSRRPTSGDGYAPVVLNIMSNDAWNFYLPDVVGLHVLNFAWIDACESVGGKSTNPVLADLSNPLHDYADAFNIDQGDPEVINCFVGWSGGIPANLSYDGVRTQGSYFREEFWKRLGMGLVVNQAKIGALDQIGPLFGGEASLITSAYVQFGNGALP